MQHTNSKIKLPDQPFRGIDSFRYADREIFSEREEEKEQLYNLIQIYRGVLLYGQSGIGKSSLIAAGLIPHLEKKYQPEIIRLYPSNTGAFVISTIVTDENTGAYLPSLFDKFRVENNAKISLSIEEFERTIKEKTFKEDKLQSNLGRRALQQSLGTEDDMIMIEEEEREEVKAKTPILIFDQFEELITLFEESGSKGEFNNSEKLLLQQKIIEVLSQCYYNSNLKLKMLFVFREDYLAKFSNLFDVIPDLYNYCLRLKAIPKEKLDDIIKFPFKKDEDGSKYPNAFSETFSQKLSDKLKEYFNEDDVSLTDVQIACLYLYRKVADREKLLDQPGPIKNILEQFYLDILNQFSEKEKPVAISILSLLVLNDKTRNIYHRDAIIDAYLEQTGTKKISGVIARKAICEAVLNKLENEAKIIRQETRKGQSYYEIRSEAIIPYINQQKILRERNIEIKKKQKVRNQWLAYSSIFVLLVIAFAIYNISKTRNQKKEITTLATLLKALYKGYEYEKGADYLKAFQIYERLGKEKMQYINQKVAKLEFNEFDISGTTIYPLGNNFILAELDDSTYRLWKIISRDEIKLYNEFRNASNFTYSKEFDFFALFTGNDLILFDCERNKADTILNDTSFKKQLRFSGNSNLLTFYGDNRLTVIHPRTSKLSSFKIGSLYQNYYQNLFGDANLYNYYNGYVQKLKAIKDSLMVEKTWDMYYTSWLNFGGDSVIYLDKGNSTNRLDKARLISINLSSEKKTPLLDTKFAGFTTISKNFLLLYSKEPYEDYYNEQYKNVVLYNRQNNSSIKLQPDPKAIYSKVQGKDFNNILKDNSGNYFLIDTVKGRLVKLNFNKDILSFKVADRGDFILLVQKSTKAEKTKSSAALLYKYDIASGRSRFIDSIYQDWTADEYDTDTIGSIFKEFNNDYFFKINSASGMVAYKKKIKDTSYFIIRDLDTDAEIYRSAKFSPSFDRNSKFDFTDTYIRVYDKNQNEGIVILNGKRRSLNYFSELGWPKLTNEEWKGMLNKLELDDK